MSKLSREEFESILEECFIEGYNSALEDIEEDILDEEAFDLEREYNKVFQEKLDENDKLDIRKKLKIFEHPDLDSEITKKLKSLGAKANVAYKRYINYLKNTNDTDSDKSNKLQTTFIRKNAILHHRVNKLKDIANRVSEKKNMKKILNK